jgi:uncharacterized repeat protein (TIGR01451 family)
MFKQNINFFVVKRYRLLYFSGLVLLMSNFNTLAARSAQLPTVSNLFFQTSGPKRCGHIGDWYTTDGSGTSPNCLTDSLSTDKKHRFNIDITQEMLAAAGGSVSITVVDAESKGNLDEVSGASDPTRFTLVNLSNINAVLSSQVVASTALDGTNVVFTVTTAGTYQVTSETGARFISSNITEQLNVGLNDDDNTFKIQIPDAGTNPELQALIGQFQGTMQHNASTNLTYDTYFLVGPGTSSLQLRNFDLDNGATLSYFNSRNSSPGVTATISGDGKWNTTSGNLNTGGDAISVNTSSPGFVDSGMWRIRIANLTANNQFALEANSNLGRLVIYDNPPVRAGNFIITPDTTRTTTVGNAVDHPFSVTNLFATSDIINLYLTETNPNHTVQLINASTGLALTDTDGDGKLDTGILNPNQTINLILRVTPNLASANTDQTKINGVSFMDNKIDPTKNTVRTITKTTTSPLAALSPQAGQIVINEVLFRQTGASAIENDEFIELYNPSNTAIDLTGWKLLDGNLLVYNGTDGIGGINGNNGPFVFPSGTVLNPGKYAVVWIGSDTPDKKATGASYQFYLNQIQKLNNEGEDIWLYDAQTRIVDYIAYGSDNAINTFPDSALNLWQNTYQASLKTVLVGQSISLTPNGQDGDASGCWEATTSSNASSPSTRCPSYLLTRDTDSVGSRQTSVGYSNNAARLALVKRITNIFPNRNNVNFNHFIEDGIANNDDNHPRWPSNRDIHLRGQIKGLKVEPGDEIEYTVYFLSNGGTNATNVTLCDAIPHNTTFLKHTYGTEVGIALGLASNGLPITPNLGLSNLLNDDQGEFYAPGTTPPAFCKQHDPNDPTVLIPATNNPNGAVVVNLNAPLPFAKNSGVPTNSYGFIRFQVRVN